MILFKPKKEMTKMFSEVFLMEHMLLLTSSHIKAHGWKHSS